MNAAPLISVIVPSYNSAHLVVGAVESALAQAYTHREVIVVDDGSTDDTRAVLAPYGDRIRYIHQANKGLPGARNTGIRAARGELLAFLDADDEWLPDKLSTQLPLLLADDGLGLVHSDLTFLSVESGERFQQYFPREKFQGDCYEELFFGNSVTPSTVLARRDAVERVGSFDESLTTGCEDFDLWLRLARYYRFAYTPAALTIYRLHANNMTRNQLRMTQAVLAVVQKSLAADPALRQRIGPARVRDRVAELSSWVGFQLVDLGKPAEARRYFSLAARTRPRASDCMHWLSTFLPMKARARLAGIRRLGRT